MRLLSQMHSSFRGVSGSLSVRSSFYPLPFSPSFPLSSSSFPSRTRFFFSSLLFCFPSAAFAELLAVYFTRHVQTQVNTSTLALVRARPPSAHFSSPSLLTCNTRGSLCSFFRHSRSPLFPRFLHHRSGGPFRPQTDLKTTPRSRALRDSLQRL